MRIRRRLTALAVLGSLTVAAAAGPAPTPLPENCRLVAGAATPDDPSDDREVCEVRTYFHCTSPIKVHNLALVTDGPTSWDTEPPAGSFTTGEGCGSAQAAHLRGANPETFYDTPFRGQFQGRIDKLTLHLHARDLPYSPALGEELSLLVYLEIDGVPRLNWQAVEPIPGTPSSTGLTAEYIVTVTNIGLTGINDDREHDIRLTISNIYTDSAGAFVWDATEVPSGIQFNPKTSLGTIVGAA